MWLIELSVLALCILGATLLFARPIPDEPELSERLAEEGYRWEWDPIMHKWNLIR